MMISSRKGISLSIIVTVKLTAHGSPVVGQSGGAVNPEMEGDINRISHPLGAIRNAKPMAKAAWGMASSGASDFSTKVQRCVVYRWMAIHNDMISDIKVADNPENKVDLRAPGRLGWDKRS